MRRKILACLLTCCLVLQSLTSVDLLAATKEEPKVGTVEKAESVMRMSMPLLMPVQRSIPIEEYIALMQETATEAEEFTIQDGVLISYNGTSEKVVITNTVTKIGDSAFYNHDEIKEVKVPDSVIEIGESAFNDCDGLNEIVIPDSVDTLGKSAFSFCDDLTSAVIGSGIDTVPNNAFYYCTDLSEITIRGNIKTVNSSAFTNTNIETLNIAKAVNSIPTSLYQTMLMKLKTVSVEEGNKQYYSENGCLYNTNLSTILRYPPLKQDDTYEVPLSVTELAPYAFYQSASLRKLVFRVSIPPIAQKETFKGMSVIKTIYVPKGCLDIYKKAYSAYLPSDIIFVELEEIIPSPTPTHAPCRPTATPTPIPTPKPCLHQYQVGRQIQSRIYSGLQLEMIVQRNGVRGTKSYLMLLQSFQNSIYSAYLK